MEIPLLLVADTLAQDKLSLLSLLDEESTFPSATDDTLLQKFVDNVGTSPAFSKSQSKSKDFTVVHYAGRVTYGTVGFLEKNQDALTDSLVSLFNTCTSTFITNWFARNDAAEAAASRGTLRRANKPPTVGGQFKVRDFLYSHLLLTYLLFRTRLAS